MHEANPIALSKTVLPPVLGPEMRRPRPPASMWTEILQSNAGHVKLALDAFIADLQQVRDNLTTPVAAT